MKFSEKIQNSKKYCTSCKFKVYKSRFNKKDRIDRLEYCKKYDKECFNCVEKCYIISKDILNKKLKKIKE